MSFLTKMCIEHCCKDWKTQSSLFSLFVLFNGKYIFQSHILHHGQLSLIFVFSELIAIIVIALCLILIAVESICAILTVLLLLVYPYNLFDVYLLKPFPLSCLDLMLSCCLSQKLFHFLPVLLDDNDLLYLPWVQPRPLSRHDVPTFGESSLRLCRRSRYRQN